MKLITAAAILALATGIAAVQTPDPDGTVELTPADSRTRDASPAKRAIPGKACIEQCYDKKTRDRASCASGRVRTNTRRLHGR